MKALRPVVEIQLQMRLKHVGSPTPAQRQAWQEVWRKLLGLPPSRAGSGPAIAAFRSRRRRGNGGR